MATKIRTSTIRVTKSMRDRALRVRDVDVPLYLDITEMLRPAVEERERALGIRVQEDARE